MQHQHTRSSTRKGGFTLIEIVVVLTIATLLSSLLFTAFKSVNEGNKKSSCQNNLVQIYQALRLYGQDFDGNFPTYNPLKAGQTGADVTDGVVNTQSATTAPSPPTGLGLWALYAYPAQPTAANANPNIDCDGRTTRLPVTEAPNLQTAPLASYIKTTRFFHCPFDDFERDAVVANTQCNVDAGTKLNSSVEKYDDKDGISRFNPFYNSYQTADNPATIASPFNNAPYSSFRGSEVSRQLAYFVAGTPDVINRQRRTPDTTIITWCRFHRKTNRDGNTIDVPSNSDNVLFMDGTVRYLPTKQPIGTALCEGWQRIPEETVEGYNAANPNSCPR